MCFPIFYGMVPCLTRGEMGEGFFREDVCKVFVVLWNGALRRTDPLGLSLLCKGVDVAQMRSSHSGVRRIA